MSLEWVLGLVTLVLSLAGGGAWWWQTRSGGRDAEARSRAEEERDAAIDEAERAARPPLSGRQSVRVLRRLLGK